MPQSQKTLRRIEALNIQGAGTIVTELEEPMPDILEFRHSVVHPTQLHAWPHASSPGFMLGGRFRVLLRLDPAIDCTRYEYRQFIKGTCTAQRGHFNGPVGPATWVADGPEIDRASAFSIPGGLHTHTFHEDGIVQNGHTSRFGHRSSNATVEEGVEDRYSPRQRDGSTYHLTDTYGIKDVTRVVGTRVRLHLHFEGRVIDRQNHDAVVNTIQWAVRGEDIITA